MVVRGGRGPAYTEDETEHYSDESSNDRNSDEEEEDEEEAKERDGNRILFVEMPQPKMSDDKRTLEDDYALGCVRRQLPAWSLPLTQSVRAAVCKRTSNTFRSTSSTSKRGRSKR